MMTLLKYHLLYLQDVVQFGPLSKTLGLVMLTNPQILPSIFKQVLHDARKSQSLEVQLIYVLLFQFLI